MKLKVIDGGYIHTAGGTSNFLAELLLDRTGYFVYSFR